jgi:hypothetical protein
MTTSRAAAGTPRLALELCRIWFGDGIRDGTLAVERKAPPELMWR